MPTRSKPWVAMPPRSKPRVAVPLRCRRSAAAVPPRRSPYPRRRRRGTPYPRRCCGCRHGVAAMTPQPRPAVTPPRRRGSERRAVNGGRSFGPIQTEQSAAPAAPPRLVRRIVDARAAGRVAAFLRRSGRRAGKRRDALLRIVDARAAGRVAAFLRRGPVRTTRGETPCPAARASTAVESRRWPSYRARGDGRRIARRRRRAKTRRSGYFMPLKKLTKARSDSRSTGGGLPPAVSSTSPARTPAPAALEPSSTDSTVQSRPAPLSVMVPARGPVAATPRMR